MTSITPACFCKDPSVVWYQDDTVEPSPSSIYVDFIMKLLQSTGPVVAFGQLGPDAYTEPSFVLQGQISGQPVHGWKPNTSKLMGSGSGITVVVLGIQKGDAKSFAYYKLTEPLDNLSRGRKKAVGLSQSDTKLYIISCDRFMQRASICTTTPVPLETKLVFQGECTFITKDEIAITSRPALCLVIVVVAKLGSILAHIDPATNVERSFECIDKILKSRKMKEGLDPSCKLFVIGGVRQLCVGVSETGLDLSLHLKSVAMECAKKKGIEPAIEVLADDVFERPLVMCCGSVSKPLLIPLDCDPIKRIEYISGVQWGIVNCVVGERHPEITTMLEIPEEKRYPITEPPSCTVLEQVPLFPISHWNFSEPPFDAQPPIEDRKLVSLIAPGLNQRFGCSILCSSPYDLDHDSDFETRQSDTSTP